jgi:hypothetical protein
MSCGRNTGSAAALALDSAGVGTDAPPLLSEAQPAAVSTAASTTPAANAVQAVAAEADLR